ncbi:MAG: hypothetical protein ACO1NX_10340 [Chitinophagaceae bacterium]
MTQKENSFFTKEMYVSQIDLETNEDVLERIHLHVPADVSLPVEFFFVSDSEEKLKALGLSMMEGFPEYSCFKIGTYEAIFQLSGETPPIQMEIGPINEWNKMMWDIGYAHDCKLDGWQVQTKGPNTQNVLNSF